MEILVLLKPRARLGASGGLKRGNPERSPKAQGDTKYDCVGKEPASLLCGQEYLAIVGVGRPTSSCGEGGFLFIPLHLVPILPNDLHHLHTKTISQKWVSADRVLTLVMVVIT